MNLLKKIAKNSKLVSFLSKDDIKKRYAGSYLGIVWAFVQPCVTIVIYWLVFQFGLKSKAPGSYGNLPFIIWIMCGLIPWFFFSDAINSMANVFVEYSYLVKKVVFDIEILPIIKLLSSLFIHVFFIALLVIVMALFGIYPNPCFLQIIYYSFCMVCLVVAIGYTTSSLVVFFRDMGQLLQVALQAGMWATPILWSSEMLKGKWFAIIFKLNPMYYVVEGYRSALLDRMWFFEKPYYTLYFWAVVLLLALLGNYMFKKLKPHFSDVL